MGELARLVAEERGRPGAGCIVGLSGMCPMWPRRSMRPNVAGTGWAGSSSSTPCRTSAVGIGLSRSWPWSRRARRWRIIWPSCSGGTGRCCSSSATGSPLNAAEVNAVLGAWRDPAQQPRVLLALQRRDRERHPGNAGALGLCLPRPGRWQLKALLPYVGCRASRAKLQAPRCAAAAHRQRGLPSPTARALRQARAVGHF